MVTMNDEYPGGWFGAHWGASVCDSARHLPTPVGQPCMDCKNDIQDGDIGMLIPYVKSSEVELNPIHHACLVRDFPTGGRTL